MKTLHIQLTAKCVAFGVAMIAAFGPLPYDLACSFANLRDPQRLDPERTPATGVTADYAGDDPELLANLLLNSEEKPFNILFEKLKVNRERASVLMESELAKKPPSEATSDARDNLAKRQARAAVALVRLGRGDKVWPLLRHSPDPSVRSYVVNWLKPLGADPRVIVAELIRLRATDKPNPAEGQRLMDAVLFHPDTSQRRALILALGTFGTGGLSLAERQPLVSKLLELYRNDPDSGIHGAVQWTLRQWKQQESLKAADIELSKLKDRGDRRWYVNGQGQTFAVIEGPVEFRIGSPSTEPDRDAEVEAVHRVVIRRRFAIASTEVTVEQYQRFVKTHPTFGLSPSDMARYGSDGESPIVAISWFIAAAYCNWLSEQEGLPKDQWCYLPNQRGAYNAGMTIPADVLRRRGYRLPTEAEWEYSCRSGTTTSRYYGDSADLLGNYARYKANSQEVGWPEGLASPVGSLLPNELGLFDMLGNLWEWCQDREGRPVQANDEVYELENLSNRRLIRGGSENNRAPYVRSAHRVWIGPSDRAYNFGFRLARTYP